MPLEKLVMLDCLALRVHKELLVRKVPLVHPVVSELQVSVVSVEVLEVQEILV